MQPDLPWNVAGIPPEAREAARAAARREGLSVGEWLTRRILRSLADNAESGGREAWPQAAPAGRRASFEEEPSRDAEDMFARISRSESESSGANRRIEEQIRSLGRRLEAAERSQSENSRAVNQAATEINIAAREQAQAFDQLGNHVVGLGDRLARVERSTGHDGIKDAVKGLHAGLSRLADQIAETANQSAGQIAALAGNIDSVAGKLSAVRNEADASAHALTDRMAAFEARVRAVEHAAQANAEKLEAALADVQRARRSETAEEQRQAASFAQVTDTLEKLASRLTTDEAQTAGAMARLEDQIAKVETRPGDSGFDRRLQGIEHALSDIMGRFDNNERHTAGAARAVEENLHALSVRVDAADKRHRDAIAELRNVLTTSQAEVTPPVSPAPSIAPSTQASSLDLPPFPETAAPFPPAFAAPEPVAEIPSFGAPAQDFAANPGFATDTFAPAQPASADSFIAAARRSARAASAAEAQSGPHVGLGGFTWGANAPAAAERQKDKGGSTRFVLVAGIVFIAIGAVVAGILLSRGLVGNGATGVQSPSPRLHVTATQSFPRDQANAFDAGHPVVNAAPIAAPGSPVIVLRHRPSSIPSPIETKTAPPVQAAAAPQPAVSAVPAPVRAQPAPISTLDRLTTLANAGSSKAELLVGLKYLDGDGTAVNEAEAAKWLERAANQGEAIAAYRLGTLFERGHGVPSDTAKAMQWYAVAAKLGNRKAMHNLAVAFAEGSGTPKDLTQAAQWFSKAAALGLADSEFNLAVLYERGMGVPQSLIDAYKWYAIAATQGDVESKTRLDVISTQLGTDERAAAQRAAADFHPAVMDRNANVPPDASALN